MNGKGYDERSIAEALSEITRFNPHRLPLWLDGEWYLPLYIRERWWDATDNGIPIRVSAVSQVTGDVIDARELPDVIRAVRHEAHGHHGWRFVTRDEIQRSPERNREH